MQTGSVAVTYDEEAEVLASAATVGDDVDKMEELQEHAKQIADGAVEKLRQVDELKRAGVWGSGLEYRLRSGKVLDEKQVLAGIASMRDQLTALVTDLDDRIAAHEVATYYKDAAEALAKIQNVVDEPDALRGAFEAAQSVKPHVKEGLARLDDRKKAGKSFGKAKFIVGGGKQLDEPQFRSDLAAMSDQGDKAQTDLSKRLVSWYRHKYPHASAAQLADLVKYGAPSQMIGGDAAKHGKHKHGKHVAASSACWVWKLGLTIETSCYNKDGTLAHHESEEVKVAASDSGTGGGGGDAPAPSDDAPAEAKPDMPPPEEDSGGCVSVDFRGPSSCPNAQVRKPGSSEWLDNNFDLRCLEPGTEIRACEEISGQAPHCFGHYTVTKQKEQEWVPSC
jgi:hypothetical protein